MAGLDSLVHSSSSELSTMVKKCALGWSGRTARAQMAALSAFGSLGKGWNVFGSMAGLMSDRKRTEQVQRCLENVSKTTDSG